ncbi:MAG: VCBS repeat-containing protein, partial [Bacteroidota bacterium]
TVQALDEVTYFCAVQAVESDFEGGPFSAEQSVTYVQPHFRDVSDLSFGTGVPAGLEASALVWADVDTDGDLDFIASGNNNSQAAFTGVFINTDGVFDLDNAWSTNLMDITDGDLAVADFDNDGDPDLALAGDDGTGNPFSAIYRNSGSAFDQLTVLVQNVKSSALDWGDLNNDGMPDLLITGDANGNALTQAFLSDEDGNLNVQNLSLANVMAGDVKIVDLDRDQDMDILLVGDSGSGLILEAYFNDGQGAFVPLNDPLLTGLKNSELAVYDYDDDQLPDILLIGDDASDAPATELYLNDMGTGFTASTNSLPDLSEGALAIGDYNDDADGRIDLFFSGRTDPSLNTRLTQLFAGSGAASFSSDPEASNPILDLNLSAAAFGDYDQDGKLDVLVSGRSDNAPTQSLQLFQNVEGSPNRVPTAPSKPEVKATGLFAEFSWTPPTDLEAESYTYNLYLEKVDDGTLIVSPLADLSNGQRYVAAPGNAGMLHSMTILGLEFGNYTCRVQAIGPDWEGSVFSDTTNFPFEPSSVSEDTDNTFSGGSPSAIYNGDIIFADYYRHDNRPDLVLSGQTASNPTTQLYFYDVTTSNYKRDTESEVIALENSSFAWGDFDLDGQIDLFHMGIDANGDPRSLIYLNREDALINR